MSLRSNSSEMSFITEGMLFLDWYLCLHPTWTTQSYACAERIVHKVFFKCRHWAVEGCNKISMGSCNNMTLFECRKQVEIFFIGRVFDEFITASHVRSIIDTVNLYNNQLPIFFIIIIFFLLTFSRGILRGHLTLETLYKTVH